MLVVLNINIMKDFVLLVFIVWLTILPVNPEKLPLVINTWGFTDATTEAWNAVYRRNLSSIDSVVCFFYMISCFSGMTYKDR